MTATTEFAKDNETLVFLKSTVQDNVAKAQAIARESLAKVATIKKDDELEKLREEAERTALEAERTMDCNATWDSNHPEILQELKECEQVELDLQATRARVASLSSTVRAERVAEMAAEEEEVE